MAMTLELGQNGSYDTPTRAEFEGWPIKRRHDFIKADVGRARIKDAIKGRWLYDAFLSADFGVRFKLDRKRNICALEILDLEDCMDLMEQSRLSDNALGGSSN